MDFQRQLMGSLKKIIENDSLVTVLLSALENKNSSIYSHCVNVSYYACLLARELGLSEEECFRIALGGLLHDIGKLNVSPKILYKPGKLNTRERMAIERHPVIGKTLLHDSKHLSDVSEAILCHHERYDGNGYGKGLKGTEIPLESRIISICDSFDAMVSYRSYKKALPVEQAKIELQRNRNTQFDGEMVDCFLSIVDDIYEKSLLSESGNFYYQVCPFGIQSGAPDGFKEINWQGILNRLPHIGVMYVDKYDTIRFSNIFFNEIRKRNSDDLIGKRLWDFYRPHRRNIIKKKVLKLKSGEINGWERLMAVGGKYIENRYTRIPDQDGNYDGLLMSTQDVSKREDLLRDLETNIEKSNILVQANKLLAEVYDLHGILKNLCDLVNKIIHLDHLNIVIYKYKGTMFYNVGETDGFTSSVGTFLSENMASLLQMPRQGIQVEKIAGKVVILMPLKFKNSNSGCICIQSGEVVSVGTKEMELLEAIGNHVVSAIQNHLFFVEIKEMAIRDNLTGIYNRQYFQEVIRKLETEAEEKSFTFIVADLDGLKDVNDHRSHMEGDLLIRMAADVIKQSIRRTDLVFRYGGDEFVILMPDAEPEAIEKIIERIQKNIVQRKTSQPDLQLSMSIGYAMSLYSGGIYETLMDADKNMYAMKKRRKSEKAVSMPLEA